MTLENKVQHPIHVIDLIPTYCKVNLIGKVPPLVLTVQYVTKSILEVYGSYFKQMPDEADCNFSAQNPSKIIVPSLKER